MLELSNVHAYYGESHILQGIELNVASSQCVAILGRNGAGKTTTLRSILGLVPARQGRITFKGQDITRTATYRIVRSGMAFVPENRGIFANVTVEEHLAIARSAAAHRPARKPIEYVYDVFPRLAERRYSLGGQLSGGEQQMLAVGRVRQPKPAAIFEVNKAVIGGPAPRVGEHSRTVLKDLGYSDAAIEKMVTDKAVRVPR